MKKRINLFDNKLMVISLLFVLLFANCQEDVVTSSNTWTTDGKQYLALSVGGTTDHPSGSIMAFALPAN